MPSRLSKIRLRKLRALSVFFSKAQSNITLPGYISYGSHHHAVRNNTNCKVIWTDGKVRDEIKEMYDKPRALCLWWIREHKNESRFRDGKLLCVSMFRERTS